MFCTKRRLSSFLFAIFVLCACGTRDEHISARLTPGSDPSPALPADCQPPENALAVFFGSNAGWAKLMPHTVVQIGKDNMLTLNAEKDGALAITELKLYDAEDHIVARIENGRIQTSGGARAEHPDEHTLEIYGADGGQILSLGFLNRHALAVEGMFRHPGAAPVIIAPTSVLIANGFVSGECFGDNEVDLFETLPPP